MRPTTVLREDLMAGIAPMASIIQAHAAAESM
jgi:hypothetical protein